MTTTTWWPTNKWFVATTTAAGTVALMIWTGDGINTDPERVILVTLLVQRVVAYWARNEPDVAVVQAKGEAERRIASK